jgi:hypothetical protein
MSGTENDAGGGMTSAVRMNQEQLCAWVQSVTALWGACWFVTLNFRMTAPNDAGGFARLTESIACGAVVDYLKRIDREVHGRLVQRFNRRVPRIPFLEHGAERGWHSHILIEGPYSMQESIFHHVLRECWVRSPWGSMCHIRPADAGAASYSTKSRSKAVMEAWTDTLIVEGVYLRTK